MPLENVVAEILSSDWLVRTISGGVAEASSRQPADWRAAEVAPRRLHANSDSDMAPRSPLVQVVAFLRTRLQNANAVASEASPAASLLLTV
jgi:hypothetical protein